MLSIYVSFQNCDVLEFVKRLSKDVKKFYGNNHQYLERWVHPLKCWTSIISYRNNASEPNHFMLQLLKAYRIKFQKFAAHAHKDALINETFIPT